MGRRYSPEADRFIRENFGKLPTEAIAKTLNRSVHAIHMHHSKFNREETGPHHRRWTEAEDAAVRKLTAEGVPARYIARRLGREEIAVTRRRDRLGIKPGDKRRIWRLSEIKRLREMMARGMSYKSMAAALGRGYNSVRSRAIKIKREDEKNVCDQV